MKKNKKNRNKKKINKKISICLVIFIVILIITLITFMLTNKKNNNNNNEVNNIVEKIDQMENYDYYLDENATEYYKQLYNELKEILNNEEINEEEYAKIISKLFVTDLFTLDNKISSSDIGGLQFIHTDFKEDFINIAKTTLYSNVKSNIYGDRKQELPIVSNVEINNIANSLFTYQNEKYNSYDVIVNITYQKDLDYPTKYSISLIKNEKYLQVVSGE